jgi:hypothetical protein
VGSTTCHVGPSHFFPFFFLPHPRSHFFVPFIFLPHFLFPTYATKAKPAWRGAPCLHGGARGVARLGPKLARAEHGGVCRGQGRIMPARRNSSRPGAETAPITLSPLSLFFLYVTCASSFAFSRVEALDVVGK